MTAEGVSVDLTSGVFALEEVLAAVDSGIVVVDANGELLLANNAADSLLAGALPWLLGRPGSSAQMSLANGQQRARPDDLPLARALRGEQVDRTEVVLTPRGQPTRWLELSAEALALGGAVLTVRNITSEHQRQLAASEAEERFRLTFEAAPVGIAVVSTGARRGRLQQVNAAFCELAGRTQQELLGMRLNDLVGGRRADQEATRRLLSGETRVATEQVRFTRVDGSGVWVQLHAALTRGADPQSAQAIVQAEDFDVRRRYEDRLRHLADHDALTGLFNRRRFQEELSAHIERCRRYGAEGVLLLFDLDGFKDVNDTLGHAAGDQVLLGTADVLRSRLRATDTLARLGGDEFAVLLPKASAIEGAEVARDLIERMSSSVVENSSGLSARVSATVGLTPFGGDPLDERDVLAEADIALYEAKRGDRGGVAVFRPSGRRDLVVRTTMGELIRDAVRRDRLVLHSQPIYDFGAGRVNRHELLVRLLDTDGDLIPPDRFLPLAEQSGDILGIDRWVFAQALELAKRPTTGELLVNLSAVSLSDASFADELTALVIQSGIDPRRLTIEITETAAIANVQRALDLAEQLRSLGCRLALDDFGAGFASFHYLKRLPFDVLKIDGEFVRDAAVDATSRAIISSVVRTAATIKSATIAEHVENAETFNLMHQLGVGAAQGFFIGRPDATEPTVE